MPKFQVLLTDYAWPDVDIERSVLAEIDAQLIVADPDKLDSASLAALARENNVDAIMTNWAQVPEQVIAASSNCRIVSRLGIGLDNIDVQYCTSQKIPVTNVPDYCLIEVAEHALAHLFSLSRKVAMYHHDTKNGRYELQAGPPLRRIEGQTLGIIGLGNIGRRLAVKARCLGLRVIAFDVNPQPMEGVELVEMNDLLARSDYVSLHAPLIPATKHLIGAEQLAKMKPSAYLINTSRGGLIDHDALAEALQKGRPAGAGLDVQDTEPPDLTRPPYNDPRVIVTPHAAFASLESLKNLRTRTALQVAARLTGGVPESVANPDVFD